jgi:hypothetical protein
MRITTIALLILTMLSTAQAKHTKAKTMNLLNPSRDSLLRQNAVIDEMGIQRIQNEFELECLVKIGSLVALPNDRAVRIAPGLPANRRYALPLTVSFLRTVAEAYREKFGIPLVVDSAVRPVITQEQLRRHNKSAAPAVGETASSHESGCTFDLSRNVSHAQLRWLEDMLSMYQAYNVVVVEEERRCLHVQVIGEAE